MKISYRISNLRKISDTPYIDIRPLTILVGRNSAGKSTFLRSLPLLRQSTETKASAPILWWGDYVDFGNFKSSVRNQDIDSTISFSFRADNFSGLISSENRFISKAPRNSRTSLKVDWVELVHEIAGTADRTYRRSISIRTSSSPACMRIDLTDGMALGVLKIGESEIKNFLPDTEVYIPAEGLFEEPLFLKRVKDGKSRHLIAWPRPQIMHERIKQILEKNVAKTVSDTTISVEARKLLSIIELDDDALDSLADTALKSVKKFYNSLKGNLESGVGEELKIFAEQLILAKCLTLSPPH